MQENDASFRTLKEKCFHLFFLFKSRYALQYSEFWIEIIVQLKINGVLNHPVQPEQKKKTPQETHPKRCLQIFHADESSVYVQCPSVP